ncbi:MAG: translocation/assembly module TamB domain-containing protein [Myxococcales bacterium]|nr:translocation/assembly module TamB domain-containing protein [Myxococcales bacterium]
MPQEPKQPEQTPREQTPREQTPREQTPRRARWPRRLFIGVLALFALIGVALVWGYHYQNDEALGRLVSKAASGGLRGRMEFGSIHWSPRAVVDLALGTSTPAVIKNFRIYDPWGKLVVDAPEALGRMELGPLISRLHVVVRSIKITKARVIVEEITRPGVKPGTVGLLAAFAPKGKSSGKPGPRLLFDNIDLSGLRLSLRFRHWSLELENATLSDAAVAFSGGDVSKDGMYIRSRIDSPRGSLTIAGTKLAMTDIKARHFGSPRETQAHIAASMHAKISGSSVSIDGAMTNVFRRGAGLDFRVNTHDGRVLMQRLLGKRFGGAVTAAMTIKGPMGGPRISGIFRGVSVDIAPGLVARDGHGKLDMDMAKGTVTISDAVVQTLGGSVSGGARIAWEAGDWSAKLALAGLRPGSAIPVLRGKLGGTLDLSGRLSSGNRGLAVADVTLERAGNTSYRSTAGLLPRKLSVKGSAHIGPAIVDLAGVRISGGGNAVVARGSLNHRDLRANLRLALQLDNVGGWLARRGLPVVVRSARGNLRVTGRFPKLRAAGKLTALGVGYVGLRLPRLSADVQLARGVLALDKVNARGLGGQATGRSRIHLFGADGDLTKPLKRPTITAQLDLKRLRVEDLIEHSASSMKRVRLAKAERKRKTKTKTKTDAKNESNTKTKTKAKTETASVASKRAVMVSGIANGTARLTGALARPHGSATLRFPVLRVRGDSYDNAFVEGKLLDDRIRITRSRLPRGRGGELSASGDIFFDGRLALRAIAKKLPLAAIPYVDQMPVKMKALIAGDLSLRGTFEQPRLAGKVKLDNTQLREMKLGRGEITLTPGSDTIRIAGWLYGGHLRLGGFIMTKPLPRMHLELDVTAFPVDRIAPELRQAGDVRGQVTGKVQLDADAKHGLTWASARISQLFMLMRYRPPGSRSTRLVRLMTRDEMTARYDGTKLTLDTARLFSTLSGQRGDRAEFSLGGWMTAKDSDVQLRGRLHLGIFEFFLARKVRSIQGSARTNLAFSGPPSRPKLLGSLALDGVKVQLPRFDKAIEIPRGRLQLEPNALMVTTLPVVVDGQRLYASGKVTLSAFKPERLQLRVRGDVNVAVLRLFAQRQLSHAAGSVDVRLLLDGPISNPSMRGRARVKRVEVSPRGWGRTLVLNKGEINFKNYAFKTTKALEGTYDEGRLRLVGQVRLDNWELFDLHVEATGTSISMREPKVYLAEANVKLVLDGDARQLALSGNVDLVDAQYLREFDLVKNAFQAKRTHEESKPFWQGVPLLENLKLSLGVRSTGQLAVKNRYGKVTFDGALAVTGTLANPALNGQIRAEEGTFRIPFLRGEYSMQRGDIVFSRKKPVSEGRIDLVAMKDERVGNKNYKIKLKLSGTLEQIRLGLESEPPLSPGEIATLLFTGRTTEQLRQELARGGNAGTAADAQLKQVTGDLLGSLVEDRIKRVARLDLFRLELGSESLGVRACKQIKLNWAFLANVQGCGRYERGLVGDDQRLQGSVEAKVHDYLRLIGRVQRLSTRIETETDSPNRGRIELRLRLPLPLPIR